MSNFRIKFNKTFTGIVVVLFFCLRPAVGVSAERAASQNLRENAIVQAVRNVGPAVVNISAEYQVSRRSNPFASLGIDPRFEFYFKDFFDPGLQSRSKRTSLGSGVIIDGSRGLILTNAHVIAKGTEIAVSLKDERTFEAQIVGADPDSDLAVLRIFSAEPLPEVKMGCCSDLMIGETVIAIGNPFGFSHTVTTGVISAVNRSIRTDNRVFHNFIQTDASINPGNSGGPLLNINGELIGINTAIYAKAQGIGFAIPINKARKIISDLIQYGEVVQAWIGITVQELDARLSFYMNIPDYRGIIVRNVETGSPAHQAGLAIGDILRSVGGRAVQSVEAYRTLVRNYADGDRVEMTVDRNGEKFAVVLRASSYPRERAMDLAFRLLGVRVKDLPASRSLNESAGRGVRISEIDKQSYLARIGARRGDIIRQIDAVRVDALTDFEKAVIKYRQKKSVVILLQRGDQGYYITVNL